MISAAIPPKKTAVSPGVAEKPLPVIVTSMAGEPCAGVIASIAGPGGVGVAVGEGAAGVGEPTEEPHPQTVTATRMAARLRDFTQPG